MIVNKLLERQMHKYFGGVENMPEEFAAFLGEVNETYNNCDAISSSLADNIDASAAGMKELNDQLRNEADELKQAHNELGRILNSVNQGFFSRDMRTNTYTYLSLGCERIYGYSINEFFENSTLWYDVIHPEDRSVVDTDEEKLNREEELYTQYRITHKDQSIRWIELKIIPHFKNGVLTRVDGVVNDITNRKQVETERELMIKELMKSNADLKQFSFITSHNLRAPLSNILGILKLLDYQDSETNNRDLLEMLKSSANQLGKTVDDLAKILIIKNGSDQQLSSLNLEESFNGVIATFLNALDEAGAEVITDFQAPIIVHNKVYLESIFVNLFSNAIRYRSPNRNLVIKVKSFEDENGNVIMKFTDNGIGVDLKRYSDRVFGLYQRFHDNVEGQGLGLFIMKSQIEATGGKIDIESEPDKGASFIIAFKNQPALVTGW